jgi:hypothetical protein
MFWANRSDQLECSVSYSVHGNFPARVIFTQSLFGVIFTR